MALYAIKNCEFVFKCPREWEQLQPTEMYDVKWCEMCWRKVHLLRRRLLAGAPHLRCRLRSVA